MPGRTKSCKYTNQQEGEFKIAVMDVLSRCEEAVTIDDLRASDVLLSNLSPQKVARVLSDLVNMGMVRKGKSKALNRMTYKSVAKMIEQGYEIGEDKEPCKEQSYKRINWELDEEIRLHYDREEDEE